jgi:tetratricopeptide (TPR) repeat protein
MKLNACSRQRGTSHHRRGRGVSSAFRKYAIPFFRQDRRAIDPDRTALSLIAAAELKTGEFVAGRYRIEALLGVGGMGVVYRAHDQQLGIDIALKLLRPELATRPEGFERFRHELLLARQVSSPHVVRIHDLVADGERWLISMDYVPGRSLEQHLDAQGALPQDEAVSIARQIALGLGAAHASGIVHRDLKPANVLLRDDGRACISDFGVARSAGAARMTGTGLMVGTPDYVSPEQARGEPVGPRSDLYALGLILYEMLSGRGAFADATQAESLAQRQLRAPPALGRLQPQIAPWLRRLTARLLDPNPARRLRDAEAVVAAIDAQRVPLARPRLAPLAAVGAIVAALAGTAWWAHERGLEKNLRTAATSAAPAATPLDLAALPLQSTDADADLARAYSALIGASLLAGDTATADRRRVEDALHRLGFDANSAALHPQRIAAELGARRLLLGELRRENGRLRIVLSLRDADGKAALRSAQTPAVSVAAMPPALRGALAELGLVDARAALGTVLPASEPAMRAFGRGLIAPSDAAALAAFGEAVVLEPGFIAAWWQRLLVARRLVSGRTLAALAIGARNALRDARGRDALRVQALIALIEGDAASAAERLQPLAAADPHDHHTRLLYAEALEIAGDRAAADAELQRLTASDPQNADAWLLRGQSAIRAGETQRAVDDYLLRARVLYTRLRDESGRADALNALGLGFDALGQPKQAAEYFVQAAEARARLGNVLGAAGSRRNLAWTLAISGDFEAAQAELARARALAAPLDDTALLADIVTDFGLIAEEQGDFRAALPHFREALGLHESRGDALGVAEAALNLGFALRQTGEFGDAQPHLEQAERTFAAAEDRVGIVRSLQSLAAVDIALGRYAQARERLERGLRLAMETNLVEERAVLYAELAELARQQGRLGEALAQAERALALFEQDGDARGLAQGRLRVASTHLDLESWDAAEQALLPYLKSPPASREQQALLAVRRGEIALGRGDAAQALREADAALRDAEAAHSLPARIEAKLLRTRALAATGQRKAALAELTRVDQALQTYPALALRHERALAAMAAQGDAQAAETYRRALVDLASAPALGRMHLLHRSGAKALRAVGELPAAARADAQAARAFAALRATHPTASGVDAQQRDVARMEAMR